MAPARAGHATRPNAIDVAAAPYATPKAATNSGAHHGRGSRSGVSPSRSSGLSNGLAAAIRCPTMEAFHYPPEILHLLVDPIPRLCKSKADLIAFFKGSERAAKRPGALVNGAAKRVVEQIDGVIKLDSERPSLRGELIVVPVGKEESRRIQAVDEAAPCFLAVASAGRVNACAL